MGEANRKRRRATLEFEQRAAWLKSLTDPDRIVVSTAEALRRVLPLDGACYRATFFLKYHLETAHGISGTAVVGFVNDGTDEVYSSHAWYLLDGKITDIALCRPLQPELQKRGPVLIHGREMETGWPGYAYHLARPAEGLAILQRLLQHPQLGPAIQQQEALHLQMEARAKNNALIKTYLDAAPDGLGYQTLLDQMQGLPSP